MWCSGLLAATCASPGGAVADDGAQDVVAVAEDVGGDVDRVADERLAGKRPPSTRGLRGLDADAREASGHVAEACPIAVRRKRGRLVGHGAPPVQRRPAAPHLAARRPPRPVGLRVRRLAGRRRASPCGRCCRWGRPTGTGRRTSRRRRSRPGPALLADPGARSPRRRSRAFRERNAYWIDSWPPTVDADQVRFEREWAALRAYATERGVRLMGDVPIYVAPGVGRPATLAAVLPRRRGGRRPARRLRARPGQLWGNPLYDWDALAADGYRWWIERFRRTFELVRPRARRPLPRLLRLLGGARRATETALDGRWVPGPGRAVFDAVDGRARRAAGRRRGPRRHRRRRDRAARRARLPGHGRAPVRLRPRRHRARHPRAGQPRPSTRPSTRARTTPTPSSAGGRRCEERARAPTPARVRATPTSRSTGR